MGCVDCGGGDCGLVRVEVRADSLVVASVMVERSWRAMGSSARILVDGVDAPLLADLAVRRVEMLEACWSRFRPSSELCRLNELAGERCEVSPDLLLLVVEMRAAFERTGGLFDPTVLSNIRTLGYDADFATVVASDFPAVLPDLSPTVGMGGVEVDVDACTVRLPANVGLDPGAIGKGLAADLIASDLYTAGADAVLVDLGGDIAVRGRSPLSGGWRIAVGDGRNRDRHVRNWVVDSESFGVATSTTRKRQWAMGTRHHVVNPHTGTLSDSPTVQATVVAGSAVVAETMATAALLLPPAQAVKLMSLHGLHGLLLTPDTEQEF